MIKYNGLNWDNAEVSGVYSPHIYRIKQQEEFLAYAGFPTKGFILLGKFIDLTLAKVACERHDYAYGLSMANAKQEELLFVGSDYTKDFVKNIKDDDILDLLVDSPKVSNGRPFHRAASYCKAKKTALKQNNDGTILISFSFNPKETPLWLQHCSIGSDVLMGTVLDMEQSIAQEQLWKERSANALTRLHVLSADPLFAEWLFSRYDRWGLIEQSKKENSDSVELSAKETLCRLVGVPSGRALLQNRAAVEALEKLDREYYKDLSIGYSLKEPANRP